MYDIVFHFHKHLLVCDVFTPRHGYCNPSHNTGGCLVVHNYGRYIVVVVGTLYVNYTSQMIASFKFDKLHIHRDVVVASQLPTV